ncbi:MAG: nucleotide-binding protein [Clostridia bacterium]|nr:nucleotide-binding protein [Clostridia bacterium]
MRDKVFIVWSGSRKVAELVKGKFDSGKSYVCSIGGNSDNNSSLSSVGDTVIKQIKECNQAIVIFQNKDDGSVSNNLYFELGYVLASYGQKKVHCVKRAGDAIKLPSDFDSAFVEEIKAEGELTDEKFADGIIEYFLGRQKLTVTENKMYLINNRYLIRDKISSHYSEKGSKCSDYELAQYILFYLQAAHMFGDETKFQKEITEFKNAHYLDFSPELSLAVNMSLTFINTILNIKTAENNSNVYIEQETFWRFKKDYEHYLNSVQNEDTGVFDEWMNLFIYEHFAYACMLMANNPAITPEMHIMMNKRQKDYSIKALDAMAELEKVVSVKDNNDDVGLLSLLRAYIYRNLFDAKKNLGEEGASEYLKRSFQERSSLKNIFGPGTVDTQLYNTFCMEYYLALMSYLDYAEEFGLDEFDVEMYLMETRSYLNAVKQESSQSVYIKLIEHMCGEIK